MLLAACSTETVLDMRGPRPDAPVSTRGLQRLVPSNPFLVGYPRMTEPADPAVSLPAEEVECQRQLKKLGVSFEPLAPIDDGGACQVPFPVKMSAIGRVNIKPAATVSCRMALGFAQWTKEELTPAARWRYFSDVHTIHQGSSYSCRNIRGSRTASEHSKGNAMDVMRIELNSGKDIDVRKPGWFSFREKGLLSSVREDACGYFTTVLGPGYDRDHADHFHFDIKERRNGYRACR